MRRVFVAVALVLVLCAQAFALSDSEYKKFMKNAGFAAADKELTKAYNEAKKSMSKEDFAELRDDQREWVKSGRDEEAQYLIEDGVSRIEAYAQVTFARAQEIREAMFDIDEIEGYYDNGKGIYLKVTVEDSDNSEIEFVLNCDAGEWEDSGKLVGNTFSMKSGRAAISLEFIDHDTVKISTNSDFKKVAGFNATGTYKRHYGK